MSNVSWVRSGGPLAPFADGYGAELARLGFTHHSVVTHVVLMGQLSRWMSDAGSTPSATTAPGSSARSPTQMTPRRENSAIGNIA
jgi:hypothetical protein